MSSTRMTRASRNADGIKAAVVFAGLAKDGPSDVVHTFGSISAARRYAEEIMERHPGLKPAAYRLLPLE